MATNNKKILATAADSILDWSKQATKFVPYSLPYKVNPLNNRYMKNEKRRKNYLAHEQRVLHPNDPFGYKQTRLAESTAQVLRDRVFNEKNKGQKERNLFYASMGPVSQGALEFADSYFSRNLSNKGPAPAQREFRTYLKNRPGELKGGRTSRKTRKVLRLRKRRQTKRR